MSSVNENSNSMEYFNCLMERTKQDKRLARASNCRSKSSDFKRGETFKDDVSTPEGNSRENENKIPLLITSLSKAPRSYTTFPNLKWLPRLCRQCSSGDPNLAGLPTVREMLNEAEKLKYILKKQSKASTFNAKRLHVTLPSTSDDLCLLNEHKQQNESQDQLLQDCSKNTDECAVQKGQFCAKEKNVRCQLKLPLISFSSTLKPERGKFIRTRVNSRGICVFKNSTLH